MPSAKDAPLKIFVDAKGIPKLEDYLAAALANTRFKVVNAPSKAGYILHVTIIKEGEVSQDNLKKAVMAGYGKKTSFSGHGNYGILADVLLVTRKVPQAKGASHQKLKTISSRNAIASAQMRLGIGGSVKTRHMEFIKSIVKELADRLRD